MKVGEVEVDGAIEWVFRSISPLKFINEQMGRNEPVSLFVARVWSFPLGMMLMVELAAIAFAGLNVLDNKEVMGVITVTSLLELIVAPLIAWVLLKVFRASTALETVVTSFTPVVLFAPVSQALGIAAIAGQYHIAQYLIANSGDALQAFEVATHSLPKLAALMPRPIPFFSPLVGFVSELGELLLGVLTCEAIAWHGRHDRLRVYLAVSTANAFAQIPQIAFHLAEVALTARIAGLAGK